MHTGLFRMRAFTRPVMTAIAGIWVLSLWGLSFCAATAFAAQSPSRLQIITSFPPSFYEPFVQRFSELYPDINVSILNKKTTSAIAELRRGNDRQFDVFWSSSPDAFEILKIAGVLRRPPSGRRHSTIFLNDFPVDDPEGYFYGFAVSGVGWMWNKTYFTREKLTGPSAWSQLDEPRYYNHISMSAPSHSGSTHLIVESMLQGMGWVEGWAHLTRMSGNLITLSARSFSVTEGVKSGMFGLGLVIDMLGRPKGRDDIDFRYGEPAFFAPATVAALKNSINPFEAELFIDFLLSPEGQKLLLKRDINRLPVSKAMYENGTLDSHPLLKLIKSGKSRPYDAYLSQLRYSLVNQLFDEMITYRLLERRRLWKRLITLEKKQRAAGNTDTALFDRIHSLLAAVPVTEEQSRDPEFTKIFADPSLGYPVSPERHQQILQWQTFIQERLSKAKELLDKASTQ
ncbi:ABC transporter substrate-binding protein [Oleidesulfovibrio sp.]|uniref:ABC transporter substrate-binding protein n=1 Tax=Oleidesulfovibrio sp. TaxID=2909707 RepID=UPI003A8C562B